jgi:hypothetical protein
MMKRLTICVGAALLVLGGAIQPAWGDEVTDWNRMMLRAAQIAGSSPLAITRVAAIVQAAVFDAVNGIDRRYTPIHVASAGPAGASTRAAAVQAAYVTLSKLFPTQQAAFDSRRAAALVVLGTEESSAAITSGLAWGDTVGNAIWTWRQGDGSAVTTPTWPGNTALGQWRPTPNAPAPGTSPNGAGYPQFFGMTPWAIASASQFRAPLPPALTGARYARDFNEAKTMGSQSSTVRSPDQTLAALFWNGGTASSLWNTTALSLIDARSDEGEEHEDHGNGHRRDSALLNHARLLGAVDVAMADAAIACWDTKYTYNFWRPITAIRELADDGNAGTSADATWTPLLSTPAHPSYASGHSCVSAAAAAVLADEFGARARFTVESDALLGVTRSFHGFAPALEEVKNARIFGGIHFRFDTEAGQTIGAAVAEYVLQNAFQRLR